MMIYHRKQRTFIIFGRESINQHFEPANRSSHAPFQKNITMTIDFLDKNMTYQFFNHRLVLREITD